MQNRVYLAGYEDVVGNVMTYKREPWMSGEMRKIGSVSGDEIVHPDHLMPVCQESVTEVTS
jgi:hypothetical protein